MTCPHPLHRRRRLLAAVALAAGLLGATTTAAHAQTAPGDVYFTQTSYVAHESQGYLSITIARTDPSVPEQVRYGVRHLDAEGGLDLQTVPNTLVQFQPGQSTFTFQIKIIDHGMNAPPVSADAYLFGSYPQSLGDATGRTYAHGPVNAKITILRDDPLQQRNPLDLLGFGSPSAPGSTAATSPAPAPSATSGPLAGVPFYVDGARSPAGQAARRYRTRRPSWSRALTYLADQPGVHRFFYWRTPRWPAHTVARYLESVANRSPRSTIQLSTYSLVHGHCGANTSSPAFMRRYAHWMQGLARGIGNFHVAMFLELDSLITTPCMTHQPRRLAARLNEVRDAVQTFEALPHTAVYIDAGAGDALSWRRTVSLLRRAGVQDAQGFFLNSTHFDWTTKEVAYGQRIARALGGVHFVVNTGENGRGPLAPPVRVGHGNEELCNPPGRGLGPMSVQTGYTYVDGFLWFTNPGGSGGSGPGCGTGAPKTAVFWPRYAVGLVRRADFHITGPREHLLRDGPYVPYDSLTAPNVRTPR